MSSTQEFSQVLMKKIPSNTLESRVTLSSPLPVTSCHTDLSASTCRHEHSPSAVLEYSIRLISLGRMKLRFVVRKYHSSLHIQRKSLLRQVRYKCKVQLCTIISTSLLSPSEDVCYAGYETALNSRFVDEPHVKVRRYLFKLCGCFRRVAHNQHLGAKMLFVSSRSGASSRIVSIIRGNVW